MGCWVCGREAGKLYSLRGIRLCWDCYVRLRGFEMWHPSYDESDRNLLINRGILDFMKERLGDNKHVRSWDLGWQVFDSLDRYGFYKTKPGYLILLGCMPALVTWDARAYRPPLEGEPAKIRDWVYLVAKVGTIPEHSINLMKDLEHSNERALKQLFLKEVKELAPALAVTLELKD